MFSKQLEAKIDINKEEAVLPEGLETLSLEYYIVESELVDEEQDYNGKSYGVEIIKKEFKVNNNLYTEKKVINNICCCKETIKLLVNKLIKNTVTPVGLDNVLEDLIGIV